MELKLSALKTSVLIWLASIHQEGVENVTTHGLDKVLESRNKELDLLLDNVGVDNNAGLERLPLLLRRGIRLLGLRVLPLDVLRRVVLHLHDYILGLLLCVDTLVENFDNAHGWEFAGALVLGELRLLSTENVRIGIDSNVEPVVRVVLIGVARDANLLHKEQVLEKHHILVEVLGAKVFQFIKVELHFAPIDNGVFECEDRILEVGLLIRVCNEEEVLQNGIIGNGHTVGELNFWVRHQFVDKEASTVVLCSSERESTLIDLDLVNLC